MKIFAILLYVFGGLATIGELAYVKYFAGERIGQYTLYERDQNIEPAALWVDPDDLPVRVSMKIFGWRNSSGANSSAKLKLSNGHTAPEDEISWSIHPDEDNDARGASLSVGPISFSGRSGYTRIEQSRIFENSTAGDWNLSLIPLNENRYELHRVEASVRYKSRAMRIWLVFVGIISVFVGAIIYESIRSKQS